MARRGALLDAVVAVALLALAVSWLLPSLGGWLRLDDFNNLRWVMEYRDDPLAALVHRHSVHDHIRPLTLLTIWAGAMASDGDFRGPQAALVLLQLVGLVGMGALGAAVGGERRPGLVVAALVLALPGWQRVPEWNAWICMAGAMAAGAWATVAAARGASPAVVAPLLVAAGLYQEVGWLVFPAGVAASWWAGGRRRDAAIVAGIGLLGSAYAWHPANVARVAGGAVGLSAERVAAVVVAALALAVLVRRRKAPPVGLVWLVVTTVAMVAVPEANEVNTLPATCGLVLFLGTEAWRRGGVARVLLAVPIAWAVVARAGVDLTAARAEQRADRDAYLALGALSRTAGTSEATWVGPDPNWVTVLPIVGMRPTRARSAAGVRVADVAVLPPATADRLVADALDGVPFVRERPGDGVSPLTREDLTRDGLPLDLAPGYLAIGVSGGEGVAVYAADACGEAWSARTTPGSPVAVAPLRLREGCGPLRVGRHPDDPGARVFVRALDPPVLDLRGMEPVPHVLEVRPRGLGQPPKRVR